VRCFVSLVSQPEVDLELGGPYQEWVQDVLEEVEPEADPVPCAQANVDDCLIGVVRWTKALTRLGQCTTFVVQQLRAGLTVYLHCGDGVGRTGIVSAAVVGILARLPAEEALARAEDAHAKRRFTTRSSPETEEQRTMVRTLLDQHGSVKREPASATSAAEPKESADQAMAEAKVARAPSETPKPPRLPQKAPVLKLSERSDTIEFFAVPVAAPEPDSKPVTPSAEPAEAAEPAAAQAGPDEPTEPDKPGAVQAEGPLTAQQELRRMQQRFAATAEGLSEEEAEELERLRLKRLAELKAAQKAKQEELERRYDAYCAQKAQDDQEQVSKLRGGLIVEDLPPWAQGLARRRALAGASEGGTGGGAGREVLRPSEQRAADAAAQPSKWGFDGNS
jgi:protein-tyrosine phosphatase